MAAKPWAVQRNVDRFDRVFRGVVGIWLVAVAVTALRKRRGTAAAVSGVAGLGLLQNALSGFCGFNELFGLEVADGSESDQ